MRYWLQRLAMVILLLLAVSFVTFAAMNVLGDPLFNILGPVAGDIFDDRDNLVAPGAVNVLKFTGMMQRIIAAGQARQPLGTPPTSRGRISQRRRSLSGLGTVPQVVQPTPPIGGRYGREPLHLAVEA